MSIEPAEDQECFTIEVQVLDTYTNQMYTTKHTATNTDTPYDMLRKAIEIAYSTQVTKAVSDMHDLNGTIQVCVDCVYASEYGAGSELADDNHAERYEEARQHGRIDVATDQEPTAFSKSKCEYCGSILAGERYTAYYTAIGY